MANLEQRLAPHQILGLDTAVFIYHLEANPVYLPLTQAILAAVQAGHKQAVTSVITLMELTVRPWRQHQPVVAREYEALLVHFPHLQLAEVTRDVARRAAELRGRYNIRPADALQIATALQYGATGFLTNDKQLRRLSGRIDVLLLDEFV